MILSDQDIKRALENGQIKCFPIADEENIRPTGIRLHLHEDLLLPEERRAPVDIGGKDQPKFTRVKIGSDGFILQRNAFALGSSIEHFLAPADIVCHIDGRSTLARLGLMIHCSSSTFDHIHETPRSITFELINLGKFDLQLRAGSAIGLLSFTRLTSNVVQGTHGQYHQQSGPTAPVLGYREGKTDG